MSRTRPNKSWSLLGKVEESGGRGKRGFGRGESGVTGLRDAKKVSSPFSFLASSPSLSPSFSLAFHPFEVPRGTRTEEWSRQKMRVPSVHLASPPSRAQRSKERARTWTNHPRVRSEPRGEKRSVTTSLARERDATSSGRENRGEQGPERERERGRTNARCLRGANKNSNRTFRSSLRCSCCTFYHSGLGVSSERLFISYIYFI